MPVFFRADHERPTQTALAPTAVGFVAHNITVLAILTVLVWINLRKHRGDIGGARRFGVAIAAVTFLYQCLTMTHALTLQGWRAFVAGWGNALWAGSYAFLGYLALEPNLRRRWPHALIAWTRLLAGGLRDPLVATHILFGLLFGAGVVLVIAAANTQVQGLQLPFWHAVSDSPVDAAETLLAIVPQTAIDTAGLFTILVVALIICRKRWLAVSTTAVILTGVSLPGAVPVSWAPALALLLFISGVWFASRYGLLALAAAMAVNTLGAWFPWTLDPSAFYFGHSTALLALLIGFAAWSFRNATRGATITA